MWKAYQNLDARQGTGFNQFINQFRNPGGNMPNRMSYNAAPAMHSRTYVTNPAALARTVQSIPRMYRPGFDRTGGNYGRFGYQRFGSRQLGSAVEKKFFDVNVTETLVPTAGVVRNSINLIPQGTTEITRIGRRIKIWKLDIRMYITLNATTNVSATTDAIRYVIYIDKQCNGATATVADIIETTAIKSFNNLANKGRFKVIMDRWTNISSTAGGYNGTALQFGQTERSKKYSFRFKKGIPIEFDDVTGAITEIKSNNFGILQITERAVIDTNAKIRLRFTD